MRSRGAGPFKRRGILLRDSAEPVEDGFASVRLPSFCPFLVLALSIGPRGQLGVRQGRAPVSALWVSSCLPRT